MRVGWLLALLGALVVSHPLAQEGLRPLPPLMRTVSDEAGILSEEEGRKLASTIAEIFEATGVPVILVIAETTKPERIEDYAERLAKRWRERRGLDPTRAVMIVVSIGDREMQVMPGSTLRSLDIALQREELTRDIAPLFREARYSKGLVLLLGRIRSVLEQSGPAR